jgi:hypothetical protein
MVHDGDPSEQGAATTQQVAGASKAKLINISK